MKTIPAEATAQVVENDWVIFSGGELEGKRPRALCAACQSKLNREANCARGPHLRTSHLGTLHPLCFQCYRAELDRERALKAAGELATASLARFQVALPFEPVNRARLACLKVERRNARARQSAARPFVDRRRQAQIEARHALQRLADGLRERSTGDPRRGTADALHAAELQLPEAWLPFVASR